MSSLSSSISAWVSRGCRVGAQGCRLGCAGLQAVLGSCVSACCSSSPVPSTSSRVSSRSTLPHAVFHHGSACTHACTWTWIDTCGRHTAGMHTCL